MNAFRLLFASFTLACLGACLGALPAHAQRSHEPFLQRDVPPTAWYYDNRADRRDFHANGVFPGDFAANPAGVSIGAAGVLGETPWGGSYFGRIYCTRPYRAHNPAPGYFQGPDRVWYRCPK